VFALTLTVSPRHADLSLPARVFLSGSFPHDAPLALQLDFAAVEGIELQGHLVAIALQIGGVDGVGCLLAGRLSLDFVDHLEGWDLETAYSDEHVDLVEFEKAVLIPRCIGCPNPVQLVRQNLGVIATASQAREQ
jgi:hypothetical protein